MFRLLELPAEMRIRIYEEALTHDRSGTDAATPELLRTCKQVYSEARDILYDRSTFTLRMRSGSYGDDRKFGLLIQGGDIAEEVHLTSLGKMPNILDAILPSSPVRRIVLKLETQESGYRGRSMSRAEELLNRFFYILACWVIRHGGTTLKVVEVRILSESYRDPRGGEHVSYPLAKLPLSVKVDVLPSHSRYIEELRHSSEAIPILSYDGIAASRRIASRSRGETDSECLVRRLYRIATMASQTTLTTSIENEGKIRTAADLLDELLELKDMNGGFFDEGIIDGFWALAEKANLFQERR